MTTTRTELVQRLERLAAAPAPGPSARFVDDLESRLVEDASTPVSHADDEAPRRGPRRPLAVLGVAAAVVVAIGMAALSLPAAPTRVATPISPAGPSTADDNDSDSDSDTGVDGEDARDGETDSDAREPDSGPTGGGAQADEGDAPSGDGGAHGGTAENPAASDRPAYPEPSENRFRLEAEPTPTGADLSWERYDGEDFFAYVVMRAEGEDPSYPREEGSKTRFVHKSSNRDSTTWSDTNPAVAGETRYLVVVFDREGRELARSNVAAVSASLGAGISLNLP